MSWESYITDLRNSSPEDGERPGSSKQGEPKSKRTRRTDIGDGLYELLEGNQNLKEKELALKEQELALAAERQKEHLALIKEQMEIMRELMKKYTLHFLTI